MDWDKLYFVLVVNALNLHLCMYIPDINSRK